MPDDLFANLDQADCERLLIAGWWPEVSPYSGRRGWRSPAGVLYDTIEEALKHVEDKP